MSSVYSQSLLQQISDNHRSLQVIRLNSQRLNDDHIKDLCDALIRNTIVVEVQLSWNRITDEGALRIGHLLKFNKSLRVVCLDGNEIGPKVRCQVHYIVIHTYISAVVLSHLTHVMTLFINRELQLLHLRLHQIIHFLRFI